MLELSRRGFVTGLIAMPFVVRTAGVLMPVRANGPQYIEFAGQLFRLVEGPPSKFLRYELWEPATCWELPRLVSSQLATGC
jgi:hypothetical protein